MTESYPPQPWYLGGDLLVSTFLVPRSEVPAPLLATLPEGRRPVTVAGRVTVGVAFVKYRPGGVLAYSELLVALPSTGQGGSRVTIPQIWVDSIESLRGGRELWGIPKDPATFTWLDGRYGPRTTMSLRGTPVASLATRIGGPLALGTPTFPLPTLQRLDGDRTVLSHNRVTGRLRGLVPSWHFEPAGPLGYLATRRPTASFALLDAAVVFGEDVVVTDPAPPAAEEHP